MMSHRILAASVLLGSFGVVAADPGQAKVDAGKTEVCEKGKKFLGEQKAQGKCAAEADEAAKITCSPATSKQVADLMTRCTSAPPAKTEKAAAPAAPKCRAVDPADASKVLAEAEDTLTTKCERLLEAKVRAGACTEAANRGKRLELVTQFDHTVGKTKMKDGKIVVTCARK